MRRALFALLALCATFAAAAPAWAWHAKGHRIVARLAEADLTPAARRQVAELLRGEPEPTLAGIASWADQVRDTDPAMSKKTYGWHFVNFQGIAGSANACVYAPPRDCPKGDCVVAAINRSFLALSDRKRPTAERREALKFLVHFVGDVHQPLHASPRRDHGGNDYQTSYRGQGGNLHSVWDGQILKRVPMEPADYAAWLRGQPPLARDATRTSQTPALDWAVESCTLIERGAVYPPKHAIDDHYLDAHRPLVERRLREAGSRLAAMLNYALK